MTIMMSDSLVGRVDPKSLIAKGAFKKDVFTVNITCDGQCFSSNIANFERNNSDVKISFHSRPDIVQILMNRNFSFSLSIEMGDESLIDVKNVSDKNATVSIDLNQQDHYIELSICLD
jgi:hypothetical protein